MDKDGIEVLFWDFDGVIIDSNKVREKGFVEVLKKFPDKEVEQLLIFHRANGGLSRYVKFRYFFEQVKGEVIVDEEIRVYADEFSTIMKGLLTNRNLLIQETLKFIKDNYTKYRMYLVSGSDQNELKFLCRELGIAHYFKTIHGSPTPKTELLNSLLNSNGFDKEKCVMIGDSQNDYEAAFSNGIHFLAYNNPVLEKYNTFAFSFAK